MPVVRIRILIGMTVVRIRILIGTTVVPIRILIGTAVVRITSVMPFDELFVILVIPWRKSFWGPTGFKSGTPVWQATTLTNNHVAKGLTQQPVRNGLVTIHYSPFYYCWSWARHKPYILHTLKYSRSQHPWGQSRPQSRLTKYLIVIKVTLWRKRHFGPTDLLRDKPPH